MTSPTLVRLISLVVLVFMGLTMFATYSLAVPMA